MTKMVNHRWSRLRRRASFGAVSVLLLSGLAACGGEAEASRLLASCGGSATRTPFDAGDQRPDTIGAVSFRVSGARAGESILGLDDADGGNAWLVVSILIDNPTSSAIHVDSDDYVLLVDGERIKETADESDDVSERLGVDEMGNVMGSSVGAGRSEPFALIYEAPTDGESYELSVSHDGRAASFDLLPAIDSCMETAALIPTTAAPTPKPTEAQTSTPAPTATMNAVQIAQANATDTPRPAPTRTATPRATATEAPPSNVTHLDWELTITDAGPWYDDIPGVRRQTGDDSLWFFVGGRATNESNQAQQMDALLSDLLLFNDRGDDVWAHSPGATNGLIELTRSRVTSGSVQPGRSGTFLIVFEMSRLENPFWVDLTDQRSTLEIDLEEYVDASFGG